MKSLRFGGDGEETTSPGMLAAAPKNRTLPPPAKRETKGGPRKTAGTKREPKRAPAERIVSRFDEVADLVWTPPPLNSPRPAKEIGPRDVTPLFEVSPSWAGVQGDTKKLEIVPEVAARKMPKVRGRGIVRRGLAALILVAALTVPGQDIGAAVSAARLHMLEIERNILAGL